MRRTIVITLLLVGMASMASGAPTMYEDFDYTVGTENQRGQGPRVAPTTQTPHDDFDVYEGSLYYSDGVNALQTSGNSAGRRDKAISPDTSNRSDVEMHLNATTEALFASTQTIYMSLLWQSGGGQVGLRDKNTGSGWTGGFTMITDMNYWGPGWKLSASDIDGTSETDGGSTETWDFTPARFFVIKIDNVVGGADTISIIYDPADLTTEDSWAAPDMQTTTKDIGAPDKLWLYTWPDTTYGNGNLHERTGLHIDEIRIGTSWADVTPVPEPATVAVLGISFVLAALLRRRR